MTKRVINFGSVLILSMAFWSLSQFSFAQSVQKMKCEAIISDANDFLIINQTIGMRLSVRQGSLNGRAVYVETINPTTQPDGSVEIRIGNGRVESGKYEDIDWINGTYFVTTETDLTGGKRYKGTGMCKLLQDKKLINKSEVFPSNSKNVAIDPVDEVVKESVPEKHVPIKRKLIINHEIGYVSCYGEKDGSIDVTIDGEAPPYQFLWNTGDETEDLIDVSAGTYALTVEDSEGNKSSEEFLVEEPPVLTCSGISINETEDRNDGKVMLSVDGGSGMYSYKWSNGAISLNLSGLSGGDYSVTVTDLSDCTCTTTVTVNSDMYFKADLKNASCFGASDGAINLIVGGGVAPYSAFWDKGSFTQSLSDLGAGIYSVKVIDANGTIKDGDFTITEPEAIIISDSIRPSTGMDGSIDITVNGGRPPYSFLWSTGAVTEDIDHLSGGNYVITVTDSNQCSVQKSILVLGPSNIQEKVVHNTYYSDTLGSISLEVKNLIYKGNINLFSAININADKIVLKNEEK